MKIWTSEHIFEHPWETVVQAAWRKYPNPINSSVVGVDTIDRQIDSSNGNLLSHRVLNTEWGLPAWVTRLVGVERGCYVSERSEVDPKQKTMTMKSRNLTFCNFVTIDEQVTYIPHPSNPKSTVLRSESHVMVRGMPMTDYLEGVIKKTMSSKAGQGRLAIEWAISRFKEEKEDLSRELDGLTKLSQPKASL